MRTLLICGCLVAVLAGAGPLGVGQTPNPVFFTTAEPLGNAVQNPHIIQMIVEYPTYYQDPNDTPEFWAGRYVGQIQARGLVEGKIALFLGGFGMGGGAPHGVFNNPYQQYVPLVNDHEDGLPPGPNRAFWWKTPWMNSGKQKARLWMQAFAAKYKESQTQGPIPDPTRFVFDNEAPLLPYGDAPKDLWIEHLETWHYIKTSDSRYSDPSYPIPGWGATLKQLYEDAGSPGYDPTIDLRFSNVTKPVMPIFRLDGSDRRFLPCDRRVVQRNWNNGGDKRSLCCSRG